MNNEFFFIALALPWWMEKGYVCLSCGFMRHVGMEKRPLFGFRLRLANQGPAPRGCSFRLTGRNKLGSVQIASVNNGIASCRGATRHGGRRVLWLYALAELEVWRLAT